ncbi:hypothetical protein D3C77_143400 [compost metagenome]
MRFDLRCHLFGAGAAGAWRQLDIGDGVALILSRQERGGQLAEAVHQTANQQQIDHQVACAAFECLNHPTLVAIGHALKTTVEPAEKPAFFVVLALGNRLEQRRAQGWRQAQGEERREQN